MLRLRLRLFPIFLTYLHLTISLRGGLSGSCQAFDTGQDVLDSGHGYRQALEIAIALKQSAESGHRRISLPLEGPLVADSPAILTGYWGVMWLVGRASVIGVRQMLGRFIEWVLDLTVTVQPNLRTDIIV